MDFLYLILGVIVTTITIIIIVYTDRKITTSWVFWVGVVLMLAVFVGIPAAMFSSTRNL